jgi:hypothetical protein
MKNLFLLALGAAILCTLSFCKNTPLPEGQKVVSDNPQIDPNTPVAAVKRDSTPGFQGCDKATWSPVTVSTEEFVYHHYTVRVTRNADGPGEQITVLRDSGRTDFVIPMPEAGYFNGISHNKLFVDAGTGPDNREMFIFDLDKRTQFYNTIYCGEPTIFHAERLHFLLPVDEKDVAKMPDCPEKEQWTKDGLRVGYGQRCIFNLKQRALARKSEWACVPMQ